MGPRVIQNAIAFGGFAYGVLNGDLHVHGDGRPIYTLESRRRDDGPPLRWLLELPSRMLDVRYRIVPFDGRRDELLNLAEWRDRPDRLSALLLHGPGGQGKTRLAAEFADLSTAAGWKIVSARHGGDTLLMPDGRQDLGPGNSQGLLLVVDYADRWPHSHLEWLLRNRLIHQPVQTRVLMIARSTHFWPAIRHALNEVGAKDSDVALGPLADGSLERSRAFDAARDRYGSLYGIQEVDNVVRPPNLDDPSYKLVLSLHMAALAAVDAHRQREHAPLDPSRLSAYLLRREYAHWARLYGRKAGSFQSPPDLIAKATFVAAMTGEMEISEAQRLMDVVRCDEPWRLPIAQVIDDHAICYPPSGINALAPLYPDRLAEDYLALSLPGHDRTDHSPDPWAATAGERLLNRSTDGASPAYAVRAITTLAAAGSRWDHIGPQYVFPLLRRDPQIAIDAGSAALVAIATIPEIDVGLLEDIQRCFPVSRNVDLDGAFAVVYEKIAEWHLQNTHDRETVAYWLNRLVVTMYHAGRHEEALPYARRTVEILGELEHADPTRERRRATTAALVNLALCVKHRGPSEVVLQGELMVLASYRGLAEPEDEGSQADLALALSNAAGQLSNMGRADEAEELIDEAVEIRRRLYMHHSDEYSLDFAFSLGSQCVIKTYMCDWKAAIEAGEQAVDLFRKAFQANPRTIQPDLARALFQITPALVIADRLHDAIAAGEEAITLYRDLADTNPVSFTSGLAGALHNAAGNVSLAGRPADALVYAEEAVSLARQLVSTGARDGASDLEMYAKRRDRILEELRSRKEARGAPHSEAVGGPESSPNRPPSEQRENTPAVDHEATILTRAETLLSRGKMAAAERVYRRGANMGSLRSAHDLAGLLAGRGDFAEAEELYKQAVDGGHTPALGELAALLLRRGETKRAVSFYRRAVAAGDTDALYRLAVVLDTRGNEKQAEVFYRRAIEAGSVDAARELAALTARRGDLAQAEGLYRSAIEAGDSAAVCSLGHILANRGDLDQAELLYQRAVDAGVVDALRNLALLYENRGDRDKAEGLYRRAVDAGDMEALRPLARLSAERGDLDEAEELYRRSIDSGSAEALGELANLHANNGRLDEAEPLYRRAIRAGYMDAARNLGLVMMQRGDAKQAERFLQRAVRSGNARAHADLARLLAGQGKVAPAESHYRRAISAGDTDAIGYLAVLLMERGRVEEAEALLRRGVDLGQTPAMHSLANILFRRGDYEGAEALYHRAIDAGHTHAVTDLAVLVGSRNLIRLFKLIVRYPEEFRDRSVLRDVMAQVASRRRQSAATGDT